MPNYEYVCTDCGKDYVLMRSIAERNDLSYCPFCNHEGVKTILTAPNVSFLSKNSRIAHETNERSRHAPQTMDQYKAKQHKPGCSCCSGKKQKTNPNGTPAAKSSGSRPWMISHW